VRERHRIDRIGYAGRLLQHAGDLLQRRARRRVGVGEHGQVVQWVVEPPQVQRERRQHADLQAAVRHPHRADAQYQRQ